MPLTGSGHQRNVRYLEGRFVFFWVENLNFNGHGYYTRTIKSLQVPCIAACLVLFMSLHNNIANISKSYTWVPRHGMIGKDVWFSHNIDGLLQGCSNSGAIAVELLQFCTMHSIWYTWTHTHTKIHPCETSALRLLPSLQRHRMCHGISNHRQLVSIATAHTDDKQGRHQMILMWMMQKAVT